MARRIRFAAEDAEARRGENRGLGNTEKETEEEESG
jgi:hypothetical protein